MPEFPRIPGSMGTPVHITAMSLCYHRVAREHLFVHLPYPSFTMSREACLHAYHVLDFLVLCDLGTSVHPLTMSQCCHLGLDSPVYTHWCLLAIWACLFERMLYTSANMC